MGRYFVPRMGIMAVLGVATLLIGVIVLRSPDTHSNLWNGIKDGYFRTPVGVVAEGGQTAVARVEAAPADSILSFLTTEWLMVPQDIMAATGGADTGRRLYVDSGCAKCHGLEGGGGVVGPPLAGRDPQVVTAMARMGPGGMPAFSPDMLPESGLAEIAAYLKSLGTEASLKVPEEQPGSGPAPVMPEVEIPAPVTVLSIIPEATPAGDPVRGETLFAGKCAACHGQGAQGGYGPPLSGVGPESVETAVRQGKGRMPALGSGAVQDRDLEDIVAYLLSLAAN